MNPTLAVFDPSLAALILAGLILAAIVALTIVASDKSPDTQKNMFGVIGVMVGSWLAAASGRSWEPRLGRPLPTTSRATSNNRSIRPQSRRGFAKRAGRAGPRAAPR